MIKECIHCGESTKDLSPDGFCCLGCASAYKIINSFGLGSYYDLRQELLDEEKNKPDISEIVDISEFVLNEANGLYSVSLMIQGLHCAACVWLVESILKKQKNVVSVRINLSRKTLFVSWKGAKRYGDELVSLIYKIGYKLLPFDQEILNTEEKKYNDSILRSLAVAGFGLGNVMLFSFSLWFSDVIDMGKNTRSLLHFFSALIALPVIIFAARPFFSSALKSIRFGYPNMDFAISVAIFLATSVSFLEMLHGVESIYFDSALMLVFFLLIGRYLDLRVRKRAFSVVAEFSLLSSSFGRIEEGSRVKALPIKQLREGMILVVSAGEKIAADGVVIDGESNINTCLITGEAMPKKASIGSKVFAGMINLSLPIKVRVTKSAKNSLLSEIIRLSSEAENKKSYYVRISDRIARFYVPVVHLMSFFTFCFWFKSGWEVALMNATAVLIITCPCALALAVPIVQTIAISNFVHQGLLVKSGEVLEKLCEASIIVFDKTGSLTFGMPRLVDIRLISGNVLSNKQKSFYLQLAASLAKKSKHPLSQAILLNYNDNLEELKVSEIHGLGLESTFENKSLKLGRRKFCDIKSDFIVSKSLLSCFMRFDNDEMVFLFEDRVKQDAKSVILQLQKMGKEIILLSGDRKEVVADIAKQLQIPEFYFSQTPASKMQFLEKLKIGNKKFIMVGDGVNDAPALALSDVSVSFSNASDIARNIADIVIQGEKLIPLVNLIHSSKKATSLMRQSLIIALVYNLIAVPFATIGFITPLNAAIAMSSSSLLVLFNSLRMNKFNFKK